MRLLTTIIVCTAVAGCMFAGTAFMRLSKEMPAKEPAPEYPMIPPAPRPSPPPPAPPPPPVPYEDEIARIDERMKIPAKIPDAESRQIRIPASSTYDQMLLRRVPTINEATDQIVNQLFPASTGIVAPTEASIDETFPLTLIIDPTVDETILLRQLESENPDQSIIAGTTKISSLAWPVLIAPDFIVDPATAAEQAVTKDSATTWTWQLKPKTGGKFTVIVELYAIVYIGDQQTKKKYKTLKQPITITVPPEPFYIKIWNWIDSKWEWLWGAVVFPIAGLIYAKLRRKKRKK